MRKPLFHYLTRLSILSILTMTELKLPRIRITGSGSTQALIRIRSVTHLSDSENTPKSYNFRTCKPISSKRIGDSCLVRLVGGFGSADFSQFCCHVSSIGRSLSSVVALIAQFPMTCSFTPCLISDILLIAWRKFSVFLSGKRLKQKVWCVEGERAVRTLALS